MNPPFRADQVGSLLRPEKLKRAREEFLGPQTPTSAIGPHDNAKLRVVEDECIRDVIAMQERVGLEAWTDGEFRRRSWWLELIMGWKGFEADRTGSAKLKWRDESGVTQGFSELRVTGKIAWRPSSVVRAFNFLKENTRAVPKVTIPAPNCIHYYAGGDIGVYKDKNVFWNDLVGAYRQELKALVEAGARYIQLDDTSIAFICDPAHREYVRSWARIPTGCSTCTRKRSTRRSPACRGTSPSRFTSAAATAKAAGRPKAATTRSPMCSSTGSTSTAISSSTTRSARAASSRCGCCPRVRSGSSSGSFRPRSPTSRARTF